MQLLHILLVDGSVRHEEFTRSSWEKNLGAQGVDRVWTHPPTDCSDPVERIPKKEDRPPPLVEDWKPTDVEWPPFGELTPKLLVQLSSHLCIEDAQVWLWPPNSPRPSDKVPNRDGQFSLF